MGEDAQVREWAGLAYFVARDFYFPGADRDDVRQEALVGLLEGLRNYRAGMGHEAANVDKKAFLAMCVRRHLGKRLEAHLARKRAVLTDSARSLDMVPGGTDPHSVLVAREEVRELTARWRLLSPLERRAMLAVVNGTPYRVAGVKDKAIDNAAQRARRKLRAAA